MACACGVGGVVMVVTKKLRHVSCVLRVAWCVHMCCVVCVCSRGNVKHIACEVGCCPCVSLALYMKAIVFLPRLGSMNQNVLMDGKQITGVLKGDFVVFDNVGSGDHRFERRR